MILTKKQKGYILFVICVVISLMYTAIHYGLVESEYMNSFDKLAKSGRGDIFSVFVYCFAFSSAIKYIMFVIVTKYLASKAYSILFKINTESMRSGYMTDAEISHSQQKFFDLSKKDREKIYTACIFSLALEILVAFSGVTLLIYFVYFYIVYLLSKLTYRSAVIFVQS